MAKLADALASGASGRKLLGVQFPPSAPTLTGVEVNPVLKCDEKEYFKGE